MRGPLSLCECVGVNVQREEKKRVCVARVVHVKSAVYMGCVCVLQGEK